MSKISVVCPTFNSESFLLDTLESVMAQTLRPFELIISDDGSTDNTVAVAKSYLNLNAQTLRWRVLENSHGGPGAARNKAIQEAKGEWIAFLDSDDIWYRDKLKSVNKVLASDPEINFICHNEQHLLPSGTLNVAEYSKKFKTRKSLESQLYMKNLFSTSAVVCKRKLLQSYEGFNETLMSAQDYELWLRMSKSIKLAFLPDTLGIYKVRQGNITLNKGLSGWKDEMWIAYHYRKSTTTVGFLMRIVRLLGSYTRQISAKFKYK